MPQTNYEARKDSTDIVGSFPAPGLEDVTEETTQKICTHQGNSKVSSKMRWRRLNDVYTLIAEIDGMWQELWCPYCGINATKQGAFLRQPEILISHIYGEHPTQLKASGKYQLDDRGRPVVDVAVCGRAKLTGQDLIDLERSKKVPRVVCQRYAGT